MWDPVNVLYTYICTSCIIKISDIKAINISTLCGLNSLDIRCQKEIAHLDVVKLISIRNITVLPIAKYSCKFTYMKVVSRSTAPSFAGIIEILPRLLGHNFYPQYLHSKVIFHCFLKYIAFIYYIPVCFVAVYTNLGAEHSTKNIDFKQELSVFKRFQRLIG